MSFSRILFMGLICISNYKPLLAQQNLQFSIIPSGSIIYHYEEIEQSSTITEKNTDFNVELNWPSLQILNSKGNIHEYGISQLYVRDEDRPVYYNENGVEVLGGVRIVTSGIGFTYAFSKQLIASENETVQFFIGPALRLDFNARKVSSYQTNTIPTSVINSGLDLALMPRLQSNMNEHWYIDFSFPLSLGFLSYERVKVENPGFTVTERITDSIDLEYFRNRIELRLGVGYRLAQHN